MIFQWQNHLATSCKAFAMVYFQGIYWKLLATKPQAWGPKQPPCLHCPKAGTVIMYAFVCVYV